MRRRARAIINLDALQHNFQRVRQLAPTSQVMAVIKANAYGHGMVPVAQALPEADGFASITGPCGDTMEIWLRVRNDKVEDATFWTSGCGTSIACGSMVTEMVKGRNIAQALGTSQDQILQALGGLPEDSLHCALLAANTVKAAVQDYMSFKREPWKRAYRR